MTLTEQRSGLIARARSCGFPDAVSNGVGVTDEHGWAKHTRAATAFELTELAKQLDGVEERQAARAASDAREATRDEARARLNEPFSPEEQAAIDEEHEAARRIAERADSVEGRLQRVEDVLIDIRDTLKRR